VFVGKTKDWIPDLVAKAQKVKVTAGNQQMFNVDQLIFPC